MNRPVKEMDWKQHSWKHSNFAEIERIIADVNAGRWLPPELTLDLIGSFEEAKELFKRAERADPEAVARIDSLFPAERDKYTAARYLFELGEEDAVPRIPTAAELGYELVQKIIHSDSQKHQDDARQLLDRLVSTQAAKGSERKGGRPPSPHHDETVITVWMMSYAVSRQLQEIHAFLQKSEPDEKKRSTKIEQSYPWISTLMRVDCVRFLQLGNTRSALELAGKILEISPSKVAKIVHSRHSLS